MENSVKHLMKKSIICTLFHQVLYTVLHPYLSLRLAKDGEQCKTLDEKEYKLSSDMVVISDNEKLHGIGGVMGGFYSACSMDTTNVFLEVALFDPISVTKTGRKLNLQII